MSSDTPIRILVAEDEVHLGAILEHFLTSRGYAVTMCRDGRTAVQALRGGAYDVALVDIVMPELDGLEVLRQLQQEVDPPEVITITGNGTIDTAITAIKLGAYDYIAKPYRMAEIDVMVRRAWEKRELLRANRLLHRRVADDAVTVDADDPRMRELLSRLLAAAPSSQPVLIRGEAGTGKSVLARHLHDSSGRSRDLYVEIDRRGDVDDMMAHLFGSAISGDGGGAPGVMQTAERGTVVVDLHVLRPSERDTLRAVMADGVFQRVGGTTTMPLRTRIVLCERTGGTSDEPALGVTLEVPPLRERPDDIATLTMSIVRQLDELQGRELSGDVVAALRAYAWPGNIRELRAVLTRALVFANDTPLSAAHVASALGGADVDANQGGANNATNTNNGALSELERLHIEATLVREHWHQGRAAQALGISTKTLYRKMREYGFTRPRKRKLARPGSDRPVVLDIARAVG